MVSCSSVIVYYFGGRVIYNFYIKVITVVLILKRILALYFNWSPFLCNIISILVFIIYASFKEMFINLVLDVLLYLDTF